jgi:hypothetical protein
LRPQGDRSQSDGQASDEDVSPGANEFLGRTGLVRLGRIILGRFRLGQKPSMLTSADQQRYFAGGKTAWEIRFAASMRSSCSHTTTRFHPASASACSLRWSRSTLRCSFGKPIVQVGLRQDRVVFAQMPKATAALNRDAGGGKQVGR